MLPLWLEGERLSSCTAGSVAVGSPDRCVVFCQGRSLKRKVSVPTCLREAGIPSWTAPPLGPWLPLVQLMSPLPGQATALV